MERTLSAQQFIKNQAEAENIRTVIGFRAAHLLGRHVTHRAHYRTRLGVNRESFGILGSGASKRFSQSEVDNLRPALAAQKNILRLQVAMDDPGFMSTGETSGNLLGNLKHWQVPISYGRILDRWLIIHRRVCAQRGDHAGGGARPRPNEMGESAHLSIRIRKD